jgi:hypothetical protein
MCAFYKVFGYIEADESHIASAQLLGRMVWCQTFRLPSSTTTTSAAHCQQDCERKLGIFVLLKIRYETRTACAAST